MTRRARGSQAFHATCPASLAGLLAAELETLGARDVRAAGAGVAFRGPLQTAYRACLWSRVASRVLLPIAEFPAEDGDALYRGARRIDWAQHLDSRASFAVDCSVRRARITHSHYAALRLKDAIVDDFRDRVGHRPDVDTRDPSVRINLHLRGGSATVSLDLAGDSLHRRGYRLQSGPAPLRENLAAAMLMFAGWPAPERMPTLFDPLCGSGTLLIEGALMAADSAPGLGRDRFGFEGWLQHDATAWSTLLDEARTRRRRGIENLGPILGADRDTDTIATARANLERAGLADRVSLEVADLDSWLSRDAVAGSGLLVSNPPYGGRLDAGDAQAVRETLAALVHGPYSTWHKALIVPDGPGWPAPHARSSLAVTNGALACQVHVMGADEAPAVRAVEVDTTPFANRIRRNQRRLRTWLARESVTCYRIYDADIPEFNVAVDVYDVAGTPWAVVQEYAPPAHIEPHLSAARREAAVASLPAILGVSPGNVVLRVRERQRGTTQYRRRHSGDPLEALVEVREGDARLLVNFRDYLDTGLFLDHRPVRRWIARNARGLRFLNLFAYTGAATVHAILGGARESLSVDLSARYLEWARRNLALNGAQPAAHRTLQADCLEWLRSPGDAGRFDLVFLDPPTFSNSKRMRDSFDIQRDHAALIRRAAQLLSPRGTLVFSCNRRGFRLDEAALGELAIVDWTKPSIPPDFSRPGLPHRCWMIRRPGTPD